DVLSDALQPLALAHIAAATGLDLSTTHRLIRTLEGSGHILQVDDTKRYVSAPKVMQPLPLTHPLRTLQRDAQPILNRLSSHLTETVVMVLYLGIERMVLDIARSNGSLAPYYDTWLHGPLHGSGSGKALLLTLPTERRKVLLGKEPYPIVTPS